MIRRGLSGTLLLLALASCGRSDQKAKPSDIEKSGEAKTSAPLPSTSPAGSGSGAPEKPWLTQEVAEQIVNSDSLMGTAFAGVTLGGPAPPDDVRARIAELARTNDIKLDLEIVDNKVAAVRFDVSYSGCCGYEPADRLARRLGRPFMQPQLDGPKEWSNDWAHVFDNVHLRVRVRVNRVAVRWEPVIPTYAAFVDRADKLIGTEITAMRDALGDRVIEMDAGKKYFVELPYQVSGYLSDLMKLEERKDLGFVVVAASGRIHEVVIPLDTSDEPNRNFMLALTKRWGTPKEKETDSSHSWTWQSKTRSIVAESGETAVIRAIP